MVDAADSSDYDTKLCALEKWWDVLEGECKRLVPGKTVELEFYNRFVREKSEMVHGTCFGMSELQLNLVISLSNFTPMRVS